MSYDLTHHLKRQRAFSENTFGPGLRTQGVLDHIRKELAEIEAAPLALEEWIDVVLLAFDGAWRTGATPEEIVATLVAKQMKNERRLWPDWREVPTDVAIEHVRGDGDASAPRFEAGDLLRYSDAGPTALFVVTHISANHGRQGVHRYYGVHCMGGYHGAYESTVSFGSATDLVEWQKCAPWRAHTKALVGHDVVGAVEGG